MSPFGALVDHPSIHQRYEGGAGENDGSRRVIVESRGEKKNYSFGFLFVWIHAGPRGKTKDVNLHAVDVGRSEYIQHTHMSNLEARDFGHGVIGLRTPPVQMNSLLHFRAS